MKYGYFDQIAWTAVEAKPEERLTRAEFLGNRFMVDRKARIEARRSAFQGKGDNYE